MPADLQRRIAAGELRALARAATLVENQTPEGRALIAALFAQTGRALLIGITGPPGVGKSTLVNQLAAVLRAEGKTVGIVAVDPSSPYSHGAILGDRIRMEQHHEDTGVFIRSMASRGKLGGLAQTTLEMALLLDAAGRDVVIVETVGVGQDEVEIARLADVTVLVLVPGLGDDVQAIKAGFMEIADVFAINKADLPGADRLELEIGGTVPIQRVIATEGTGVANLLATIRTVHHQHQGQRNRAAVWAIRLREMLRATLLSAIPEAAIEQHAARVAEKIEDPYAAVAALRDYMVGASNKKEKSKIG
jgi:LAO/AO transport system kinase